MRKLILMLSIACGICLSSCTVAPRPRAFEARKTAERDLHDAMLEERSRVQARIASVIALAHKLQELNDLMDSRGVAKGNGGQIIVPHEEIEGMVTDITNVMMERVDKWQVRRGIDPDEETLLLMRNLRFKLENRIIRLDAAVKHAQYRLDSSDSSERAVEGTDRQDRRGSKALKKIQADGASIPTYVGTQHK